MIMIMGFLNHAFCLYGWNREPSTLGCQSKLKRQNKTVEVIARKTVDFPEALEPKMPMTAGKRMSFVELGTLKQGRLGVFLGTSRFITWRSAIEKKFSIEI